MMQELLWDPPPHQPSGARKRELIPARRRHLQGFCKAPARIQLSSKEEEQEGGLSAGKEGVTHTHFSGPFPCPSGSGLFVSRRSQLVFLAKIQ